MRVSDKQEHASSKLFVIAFILYGRVSNEQEHRSTDLFAAVRVYMCACAHTCVRMCVCVLLLSKRMIRLIFSSLLLYPQ